MSVHRARIAAGQRGSKKTSPIKWKGFFCLKRFFLRRQFFLAVQETPIFLLPVDLGIYIYIYQINFSVVGMGPLLKLGQIRQRETGDSSCFCIFLVALLIRASADLAIVGDNFGSLLVIPMDENSWLPPCQFPAIHQIKIIVFLRFYDVEHAAAHDMMAYFSHMIARPVRRHWEGVVTFQLPDRTKWNDATVPDFACEGLPRRPWCLPGPCMVPGTVRFKVFAPSRSQSMREASAIARRVPWDWDHPSVIHEEDL